jgi:LemA protein
MSGFSCFRTFLSSTRDQEAGWVFPRRFLFSAPLFAWRFFEFPFTGDWRKIRLSAGKARKFQQERKKMGQTVLWMSVMIAVIGVFVLIGIFNRVVALRQRRKNAFADVDVQLKLRYDLVPNLVESVKGYAAHEKGVFENVTQARATAMRGGTIPDRIQAEQALGASVMGLMAVAENYPQLKADQNFRQLQADLSDIENKIAAARRFFNNATSEYNTTVQGFPGLLVAKMMGANEEPFFDLDPAQREAVKDAPKVSFGT